MNGFDIGSLSKPHLREVLQSHKSNFEAYLHGRIAVKKPVKALKGTLDALPITQGRTAAKRERTSKVANKGHTPVGNSKLDTRAYKCEEFRFAEALGRVEGKQLRDVLSEINEILRDRCGHQVKFDVELDFIDIIKGNGAASDYKAVTTKTLAADEKLDNYSGANHDPLGLFRDLRRQTGGTLCVMGWDVADALTRSPQLTGSDAGSGSEYLAFGALQSKLRAMGYTDIYIGVQQYHDGAKTFDFNQTWMHDGLLYVGTADNIAYVEFEEFQYDAYGDDDRRTDFVRALETSTFMVKYAESSVAVTNPLT